MTIFDTTQPVTRRRRTATRQRPAPSRSSTRKVARPILIVEDDAAILEMVSELLEAEGYAVETGVNGAEALGRIERTVPALVLLDMRMPVMDGWAFARELRRRGIKVPVLVMTAAEDARRWASEIGADGYLAKPFEVDDFLRLVDLNVDRSTSN